MTPVSASNRSPVFVRIAIRLLLSLVVLAVVIGVLGVYGAESINRSGGWGWLLIGGLYVAVATVVCFACVILSTISLWRREPHGRTAVIVLVGCLLEVGVFGRSLVVFTTRAFGPDPNVSIARSEAELSSALVRHFAAANLDLRPGDRAGGFQTNWFLEDQNAGPQCEIRAYFRHFPAGTPVETMRKTAAATIPPAVLNEQAGLSMSGVHAVGRTGTGAGCEGWSATADEVTQRITDSFRSFQLSPSGDPAARVR